jgi:hypothetical protein
MNVRVWWLAGIAKLLDPLKLPMIRYRSVWLGGVTMWPASCSVADGHYPLSQPACAIALEYLKKFRAAASRLVALWFAVSPPHYNHDVLQTGEQKY